MYLSICSACLISYYEFNIMYTILFIMMYLHKTIYSTCIRTAKDKLELCATLDFFFW